MGGIGNNRDRASNAALRSEAQDDAGLRDSLERFRAVARATSDAIWDWDLSNDHLWWSEGFTRLFGYPVVAVEPDLTSWTDRIHPDERELIVQSIHEAIDGGEEDWRQEYRFLRQDGSYAWVVDAGVILRDADGKARRVVGGMRDLSTQRENELERARLHRALELRTACSEAVIRAVSEQELLDEVCRVAVEIGGYRMGAVGFAYDDEDKSVAVVAHHGHDDNYFAGTRFSWDENRPGGQGPGGRVIRSGRPEVIEDISATPDFAPWREAAIERGYCGIICLPLRHAGRRLGLLALYTAEVRPITSEEVTLLQDLADDLGFGVMSLRSREENKRIHLAVSRLASTVTVTTGDEFFEQLALGMTEALGACAGMVLRLLPGEPKRARSIAEFIGGRHFKDRVYDIPGTPCAGVLTDEEVIIPSGLLEQFELPAEIAAIGPQAYVGYRLDGLGGTPAGIVWALFREPIADVPFVASTMRIFAARAAAELERSRLERIEVEQTRILEKIATGAPLEDVCNIVIELVEQQVAGSSCAVSMLSENGELLRLCCCPNLPMSLRDGIRTMELGPANGTCGTAAHLRRTVIVSDMATDPITARFRDLAAEHGVGAGWAVPFCAGDGRVLGVFTVFLAQARAPLPSELDFVSACARLTGLAVERERSQQGRLLLETQLREAQKMEAIGTLAGGIAHDFNNILGAILGNADLARREVGNNPDALESLSEIRRAGLRAKDLIQQILTFSRREPSKLRPLFLGAVLEESVRLLRAMPTRATIELVLPSSLPAVDADPVQVQQVLLNLGTNALHAMTGRTGSVEFRLDVVDVDEALVQRHPELHPGQYARLSVIDAGHGMPAATLARVFEPFFTTKPVGEGTGLGLPVVHGIMRAHGGAIVASSTEGKGSRFDLYFPVSSAEPETSAPAKAEAADAGGGGRRILYIDDDEALLVLVRRMLALRGYEVVTFSKPQQALEELRANPTRFDLVLSDYNMPRFSGLDVARAVREIRPELPMAVTSGFITDELRAECEAVGVRELIFKPDFVEELCDAVGRLIDRNDARHR